MTAAGQVLTVNVGFDRQLASQHAEILATLPMHFRITDADADICLIPMAVPDWPERLGQAVQDGARGVLVAGSGVADATLLNSIADAAEASGTVVAADTGFMSDPTWVRVVGDIQRDAAVASIIDSVATIGERPSMPLAFADATLRAAFAAQFAMIRSLVAPPASVAIVHLSDRQYVVCGETSSGTVLNLVGVMAPRVSTELRIQVASLTRRWDASFENDSIARPTQITCMDAHGSRTMSPIFESAHRNVWRELHSAITQGSAVRYGLRHLSADVALATHVFTSQA